MSVGTWGTSSTTDGRKVGALALPTSDQPTLARVVAVVNRVRTLNLPGVLRIADLVSHQGKAWLVTASPAAPTVASLAGRLMPAVAATIAADTGQTLRQLHAANIVHGALDASTVVISPAGAAQLNEVGLAAALQGSAPEVKDDVAAWATLIKQLVPGNPTLDAVAAAAAAGLETALRVLAATANDLPGFGDRTTLTALLSAAPAVAPKVVEAPPEESTTLLPAPAPAAPMNPAPAVPMNPMPASVSPSVPQDQATRMGQRQPTAQPAADLRFGKGVPAQPATAQPWTPPPPAKPKRGIVKTISAILSALLTLAVIVVVGLFLWDKFAPNPVVVTGINVPNATATPCSGVVDVVGEVQTNGEGGRFSYQWVKFDGLSGPVVLNPLEQSVEKGQTTSKVHLQWTFSGKGTAHKDATATLRILSPSVHEATGKVSYTCK